MTSLLERHRAAKSAITRHLRALAGLAEAVGMKTLARDVRDSRIPKLEGERFHLVVLGEFNHGKSTFVNALLGAEFLPVGITPTTAAINHVVYSEAPRVRASLSSGEKIELTPSELQNWVTVSGEHSAEVAYVEVGYPADILRENITLVDTPGVNDLNEQRAEITYGYVPRADAVIFLLDAGQALKESEREFLSSHVLEGSRDRLIFVLGKMDLLSDAERSAVIDYVRTGLGKLMPEPVLFPVSAKQFLAGGRQESGLAALLDYLTRFLDTDRAQIVLDNAAADAMRTAAYLQQNLGVRLHSFELDLAELEERVASVRRQLDTSKRTLDELHNRIRVEGRAIKAQVKLELEEFSRRFIGALPEQIDSADADDVKRYLGPFIEDKFREFAEIEGARIASLLERLAEDVIAVTNENVAAASTALASRLGPADTRVDIDVDSFKYDVGVYAVGALGTTLFLFVNTLAGGLLTLAAPILAIVLKSKVAGDIREQAKERVPGAVSRAAEAMGPHFDSCIDEFSGRLGDFVASAGNALYKGISEILDQTIAERRRDEEQIDTLRAETAEQVRRVEVVRAELAAMRADIWSRGDPESGGGGG
jgi:predicted GTPase